MREIKFRAWDKENKEWLLPLEICLLSDGGIVPSDDWNEKRKLDDIELVFFTGLKDKNGRECYEGDIVKNGDYVEDAHTWNEWIREVEWLDEEAQFIGCAEGERWEIIGNIYENPELLTP